MNFKIDEIPDSDDAEHLVLNSSGCQCFFPQILMTAKRLLSRNGGESVKFTWQSPYHGDSQKVYEVEATK